MPFDNRSRGGSVAESLAWRESTYCAVTEMIGSFDDGTLSSDVTSLNVLHPYKILRDATQFRIAFPPSGGEYKLKAVIEVPNKQGVTSPARLNIPLTFDNGKTIKQTENSTGVFYSDWVAWPLEVGDECYVKLYLHNDGANFKFRVCGYSGLDISQNETGLMTSSTVNTNVDSTGDMKGSGAWQYRNYGGAYKPGIMESMAFNSNRAPTVDIWGDSISTSSYSPSLSVLTGFLTPIMRANGTPYGHFGFSGSNQKQIPSLAPVRLAMARGDIAICEHGRNSSDTAALKRLWKYLRGLGYKKIIQTTTTNYTKSNNTAFASGGNSQPMRDFIWSHLGLADGVDAIWDVFSVVQTPEGLWRDVAYTNDGLHLTSAAGVPALYNAAIANDWLNDLK